MSYQNYMKQALNNVYKKKQQTQGYGQNYSQYGGSPLAGGYQPNMPTSGVNINYPQNPYRGNQNYSGLAGQIPMPAMGGYQTSPISEAIGNMPLSPNIGQPTLNTPYNWGSGGSYTKTRDDVIANLNKPIDSGFGNHTTHTTFDMMKMMMNSSKYPLTPLFDMYGVGNYDTYDEWKNAYMAEHPNNDVIYTYELLGR